MTAPPAKGAVLLLCLLLLMALSLLGLAAASDSRFQQRASGNAQQQLTTKLSAGLTLAWAEDWLMSLPGDSRPLPCADTCSETQQIRPAGYYPSSPAQMDAAWWHDQGAPAGFAPDRGATFIIAGMPQGFGGYWLVEEAHHEDWPEPESGVTSVSWYRVAALAGQESNHSYKVIESIVARPWGDGSFSNILPQDPAAPHFCQLITSSTPCGRQAWQERN